MEEEPMELPEYHPDVAADSNEDAAGGDNAEDGEDDPAASDGGDEDPGDDPEPADEADQPLLEPHYENQIHHLDFAEGPFPALLWRPCKESASH
jgi:hypothetical protein